MTPLTLLDLCLLIELVDGKLTELHSVLDDKKADNGTSDETADLSVIYANTASRLQALYESQWSSDCNYPPYLELISRKLK